MAPKVSYKQGTKATYLGLLERSPSALYFCTDTKELFKGDDLYTDGIRFVESFSSMPMSQLAADGVLYFCKDNGCGYVLSEDRASWVPVVYGVDNSTIVINENGLISIGAISVDSIDGLVERLVSIETNVSELQSVGIATLDTPGIVKASDEIAVAEDGTMSLTAIPQSKITGLEPRLEEIENAIAEIDSTDLSGFVSRAELTAVAKHIDYEIFSKPVSTLVNYLNREIRVLCPKDVNWSLQNVGSGGDPNMFYIGFKAYAPDENVMSFREDLAETISDTTMYSFIDNDFAGTDEYGRKYSVVWLPVAAYDSDANTWNYFGDASSDSKYIGWYYSVEWFDANGVRIAADTIRINLTNEDCHLDTTPYYVSETKATLQTVEESITWSDM